MLAVAVAWVLAEAQNSREVGDHAADLSQDVLKRLGGRLHPLLRRIITTSETRIRTLVQANGAGMLFAAIPHEEKVTGTKHCIPDNTTETTRVKELLEPVNPDSDYPYDGGRQDPLRTADPPTGRPVLRIRRPRERQRAAYHTEQHADEETTEIGSGP